MWRCHRIIDESCDLDSVYLILPVFAFQAAAHWKWTQPLGLHHFLCPLVSFLCFGLYDHFNQHGFRVKSKVNYIYGNCWMMVSMVEQVGTTGRGSSGIRRQGPAGPQRRGQVVPQVTKALAVEAQSGDGQERSGSNRPREPRVRPPDFIPAHDVGPRIPSAAPNRRPGLGLVVSQMRVVCKFSRLIFFRYSNSPSWSNSPYTA